MTRTITSKNNELLIHIRKLQSDRSYRYEHRQFVGEGKKLLQEALGSKLELVIAAGEGGFPGLPEGVEEIRITPALMKTVSDLTTPSEVLFVCRIPGLPEMEKAAPALVLDGIQDPGNLGTMIRTADALGIERLVLCEGCADPYNPKTIRSTMGAIFRQPIYQMSRSALIEKIKSGGGILAAAALAPDARDIRSVKLSDAAVIIGSEGSGVSRELLGAADFCVKIPISPRCESLNAAAAASIIMWEMAKK